MLLSKAKILIAAAGLAMLAIPVTALAGHKHDDFRAPRSFAAHPQAIPFRRPVGLAPVPFARPAYHQPVRKIMPAPHPIAWNNGWRERAHQHLWAPAPIPAGWNNGWHEEEEEEHEHQWASPRRYGACDEDGDDCGQLHYRWRSDDRRYYQPSYEDEQDENEDYGGEPYPWYMQSAPSSYNLMQSRYWLVSRRQRAMVVIAQLRARGDRRGADRVVKRVVNPLNAQINAIDRQSSYNYSGYNDNYSPSNYYGMPANPLLDSLAGNSGYYGGAPNSGAVALNALGAVVGPMLLGVP